MRLDGGGDATGNIVLHGEHVAQVPVVSLCPVVAAGRRVHELGGDAQPVAGPAHAALQDVAHAEFARHLFHID
jgi:hypothetical protein